MRVALVNPPWNFDNSIYFGCKEPHLPLELGCAKVLLERAGHDVQMFDGHLFQQSMQQVADAVAAYRPNLTVVTTAPSYLFWRCAQPELKTPRAFILALGERGGKTVAIGPHGSVTPETTLRKLGVDIVVQGESEEVLVRIAGASDLCDVASIAFLEDHGVRVAGSPAATTFVDLPAITWPAEWLQRHHHHHHRFDTLPRGIGAEVEASRGCPYHCTFCAKMDFRDRYRRRELGILLAEIDDLLAKGVAYIYFIDEIFLPQQPLLEALRDRKIAFGIQTRIDLWSSEMLELLGQAGCVSIEAGVESLSVEGRKMLEKKCRIDTDALAQSLIEAKRHVPFVQANLIETPEDDDMLVAEWRALMQVHGVWSNDPVPLYPYPSSPQYRMLWGAPDHRAWERAHDYYLQQFRGMSDIQDALPLPLEVLETACGCK